MRIVIDARWIRATGIGRYVENILLAALEEQTKKSHFEFVLLVRPQDRETLPSALSRLELIDATAPWYTPQEQVQIPKLLDAAKPDLVHFPQFNVPLQYRKPFVVTIHDLTMLSFKATRGGLIAPITYEMKDIVMRHVLKTAVQRSRRIFTVSNYVKQDITKRYRISEDKVILTPNALDEQRPQPAVDLKKYKITQPFMLHIGNAYPNKNLPRLVEAFAKLKEDHSAFDMQLVFVGKQDSFHYALEKYAQKLKVAKDVVFTGFVSDAEMAGLFKAAQLYVLPALSEGFGIPGLESMTYGVPVASSDATCLPEVYGKAAEYFDGKNVDDMANHIWKALTNEKRRAELIKAGREQVKKYSWKTSARALLRGYEEAINEASPGLRNPPAS